MQALRAIDQRRDSTRDLARTQLIVETVGGMNFTGNILPASWFQHPLFRNPSGRLNLPAVIVLSDILYWYRPQEIRDEGTGTIIERRRKFRADKLQKTYQSWADQFGLTKRQVKDAVSFLRVQGLITIEFRNIQTDSGLALSNVMFVEPVIDNLRKVTFEL
jgi:hypothetical protein